MNKQARQKTTKPFSRPVTKHTTLLLVGCLMATPSASAATYTLNTRWLNRYVGVIAIPAYDAPELITTFTASLDNGLYGGLLLGLDISDIAQGHFSSTRGDEADWFAGWKGPLGGGFQLDVQGVYLDFQELMNGHQGDILRLVVEINHPIPLQEHQFTPFLAQWSNIPLKNKKPERGGQTVAGIRHTMPLVSNWGFSQEAEVRFDDGWAGKEPDTVLRHNSSLNWTLNPNLTLNPLLVRLSTPLTASRQRETEWVLGFGATIQFR